MSKVAENESETPGDPVENLDRLHADVVALFDRYDPEAPPARRETARAMVDLLHAWIVLGGAHGYTGRELPMADALAVLQGVDQTSGRTPEQVRWHVVECIRWALDAIDPDDPAGDGEVLTRLRSKLVVTDRRFGSQKLTDARMASDLAAGGRGVKGSPKAPQIAAVWAVEVHAFGYCDVDSARNLFSKAWKSLSATGR